MFRITLNVSRQQLSGVLRKLEGLSIEIGAPQKVKRAMPKLKRAKRKLEVKAKPRRKYTRRDKGVVQANTPAPMNSSHQPSEATLAS